MPTTEELLTQLRSDLDDPLLPGDGQYPDEDSLWADAELLQYIDEAQKEFAVRTLAIPDSSTYVSTVTANSPWVTIDENIVEIRVGYLTTAKHEVSPTTLVDIERGFGDSDYNTVSFSDWRNATGTPRYAVTDLEAGKARLVPTPTANDMIEWSVYRLPATISEDCDDPEIESQYHYHLLTYAKFKAYMKQDAEVFDPGKAQIYRQEWEDVLIEADSRQKVKRRTLGVVAYGGI